MEGQNHLGIYLGRDAATVVCMSSQGRDRKVMGCFSVSLADNEHTEAGSHISALANLIARGCAQRNLVFSEVAVALDCAMFMQHSVHSQFSDHKQIAATVRFDTEETLAVDVSDIAIAFKIISSDTTGSQLSVFTAKKQILSDIIVALQSNNLDPVAIEPDVNCLSRLIFEKLSPSVSAGQTDLFAMLSRHSGYFVVPLSSEQQKSHERTLLVGPSHNRTELLARELPLTMALTGAGSQIKQVRVLDSTDSVDCQQLSEKLSMDVSLVDLAQSASVDTEVLADCDDPVNFAVACGSALAGLDKTQSVNFRNDFMPFMGKKRRLQKTLRFLSISAGIILIALGLYMQVRLIQKNRPLKRLRKNFTKDYSDVMMGKNLPGKSKDALKKLKSELRRIENVKSGKLSATGEKSVSAKLTAVLEAFNKSAAQTKLNIEKISITAKNISITGDTSSRSNTLKLFKEIKAGFVIQQQRLGSKSGRDTFSITVAPKR